MQPLVLVQHVNFAFECSSAAGGFLAARLSVTQWYSDIVNSVFLSSSAIS